MADRLVPIVFAIFIWWFSTGVVILLDGLPHRTFRWSLVISSAVAVGAIMGLAHTASQTTVSGAYCAFTCALLLWGWHELSFLTGWITGPRKMGHTQGCSRWRQALQAIQVILWHELWLLLSLSLLAALTWNQPNQVGLWTFAVLWCMRASAKLNLFLGVRNLGLEFLPSHLGYLQHYFRQAPLNLLMPLSITASTVIVVCLVQGAVAAPPGSAAATGSLLLATMLAMGVLEHWLLVLPLNPSALWRWAMRGHRRAAEPFELAKPHDEPVTGTSLTSTPKALPGAVGHQHRLQNDEDLLRARSA